MPKISNYILVIIKTCKRHLAGLHFETHVQRHQHFFGGEWRRKHCVSTRAFEQLVNQDIAFRVKK